MMLLKGDDVGSGTKNGSRILRAVTGGTGVHLLSKYERNLFTFYEG